MILECLHLPLCCFLFSSPNWVEHTFRIPRRYKTTSCLLMFRFYEELHQLSGYSCFLVSLPALEDNGVQFSGQFASLLGLMGRELRWCSSLGGSSALEKLSSTILHQLLQQQRLRKRNICPPFCPELGTSLQDCHFTFVSPNSSQTWKTTPHQTSCLSPR